MKEFIVNKYITLKLEDGFTNVYINGNFFTQYRESFVNPSNINIGNPNRPPSEIELENNCFTLKSWVNNNYNSDLLPTNVSIPLLKKLHEVRDPLAIKTFKREIIRLFKNAEKSDILFLIDGKYLDHLAQDEKEETFCKNNQNLRKLLKSLLTDRTPLFKEGISIFRTLLKLGDVSVKDVIKELISKAFIQRDITLLEFFYKSLFFHYLSNEVKSAFYLKNNQELRNFIIESLRNEGYSLKFGFPLLLLLFRIRDTEAKEILKKGLLKWIFSRRSTNIDSIIKKYIQPYQQFRNFKYIGHNIVQRFKIFNYKELIEIYKNPLCPRQLKEHLDGYIKKFNKIYTSVEELIISKETLMKKFNDQPDEDSENFLLLIKGIDDRDKPIIIPIYDNKVKKIIINNSESSFKLIEEKIEFLKSKLEFYFEGISTIRVGMGLSKNIYELYFSDSHSLTKKAIKKIFNSISNDVVVKIEELYMN